ncbi:sliding clamp loader subunit [Serratia phage Muldoon]|uniref:Sliding-clamp-loader small subunit n=1 Tax=Serratia phage Muldoon TaxID=2601678 RepID=A0A5P8PH47_9CAUD|nr:sliding clamp loader subunit [Serratia phage Muldoon]QFR56006.1 sliding clamp loader subunit [Serratia phage Muldoon]WDS61593.1 DNA polymerase clamp loader subunit [Cronobacter phage vB_Cdu_VP8]
MSLASLMGEEEVELNPHELAWMQKDYDAIQKLVDEEFKPQSKGNELFETLDRITQTKEHKTLNIDSDYSKNWIDLALSQHADCMDSVYVMNLIGAGMSDQMHLNYYLATIRQGKRYGKWAKLHEDLEDKCMAKLFADRWNLSIAGGYDYLGLFRQKGNLEKVLHSLKFMANESFVKTVTANKADQKKLTKFIEKW